MSCEVCDMSQEFFDMSCEVCDILSEVCDMSWDVLGQQFLRLEFCWGAYKYLCNNAMQSNFAGH